MILDYADALQRRGWAQYALQLTQTIRSLIPGSGIEQTDVAWLYANEGLSHHGLGNLERARELFEEMRRLGQLTGDLAVSSTATQNLAMLAQEQGQFDAAREMYRSALEAKRELEDPYACLQILTNLAGVELDAGDLSAAERLLEANRRLLHGHRVPHLRGSLCGQLGTLRARQTRFAEAAIQYRRALNLFTRSGDPIGYVTTLHNLGDVLIELDRTAEGIASYRRALGLVRRLRLPSRLTVGPRTGLAIALHRTGQNSAAVQEFRRIRAIAQVLEDRHLWATSTADLAALLIVRHQPDEAVSLLEEALSAFISLNDGEWQGRVLRNILEAGRMRGDRELVAATVQRALRMLSRTSGAARSDIARRAAETFLEDPADAERAASYLAVSVNELRRSGETGGAARTAAVGGSQLRDVGAVEYAIRFLGVSMRIFERMGNTEIAAHLRNDRATCYTDLERFRPALADYRHAARLARQHSDRVLELQVLMNRGETFRRMGRLEASRRQLTRGLCVADALAAVEFKADVLGNLGITLSELGKSAEARICFEEALVLGRRLRSYSVQATALGGFAGIRFRQGDYRRALVLYRRAAALRKRARNDRLVVEELAAIAETIAASGKFEEVESAAQELVDIAQRTGAEEIAARSLAHIATWAMKGREMAMAADVSAAALVLAGSSKWISAQEAVRRLSVVGIVIGLAVLQHSRTDEKRFYDDLLRGLVLRGVPRRRISRVLTVVRQQAKRLHRSKRQG